MINIASFIVGALGVNCYVITDEATGRTAVIDPGEYNVRLDAKLKELGFDKIDYILLTHGHFDHFGGVEQLKERAASAKVCIHSLDKDLLTEPLLNLSVPFIGERVTYTGGADVLIKEGGVITLGESTVTVMHTPGHSPGSVCFICGEYIFSGDTLFRRSAGRTDFPRSNSNHLIASLQKLAALEGDYTVLPGHDMATRLSEEKRLNPYMN